MRGRPARLVDAAVATGHRKWQGDRVSAAMNRRRTLAALTTVLAAALIAALIPVVLHRRQARKRGRSGVVAPTRVADPVAADAPAPAIRGLILNADGDRVGGATVRLVSADHPVRAYRDTRTDWNGAYLFGSVAPSAVRVVAEHGADGVVTSAVLHMGEQQTIGLTLVLSAASAVRGTVVDEHRAPVADAVISAEGVPWTVSATSDRNGAFRLATAPDFAAGIVAVAPGYQTRRASLAGRSETAEFVVRLVLSAADPIDGEVLDDEGNPVAARVVACEEQPSEARTRSSADGSFQLPPSAIGCDAVAEHAEFAPSDPTRVVGSRRLVLRLKTGAGVAGVVVDEGGRGLTPFRIAIESFVPNRGRDFDHGAPRTFDDPRGAFRWDRLAPGTYVLTASASGRPPARSASIAVRSGAVTTGVRIVVARGGTLEGAVTDEAHTPLASVDLRFDQVSRALDSEAQATTDGNGRYRLEGAPGGPLTVRAHKEGFLVQMISGVRVESGATRRQDFVLTALDGGATLELGGIGAGLRRGPDGLAIENVSPGDPAARAGLQAGDRIVSIDGDSTDGMSVADALQRIRGQPGTSVALSVLRPDTGDFVDRTIVRAKVLR